MGMNPRHIHWKRKCALCNKMMSWCRCEEAGSYKTLHGICEECVTKGKKELMANNQSDPNKPLETKEFLVTIGNVLVFLIDEDEVHNKWTTDFCEAGNWQCYKFIPKNEIWAAIDLNDLDLRHAVLHEFIESAVWPQFNNYLDSHACAVKLDDFMFNNAGGVDGGPEKLMNG